jgi:hypothetical protein
MLYTNALAVDLSSMQSIKQTYRHDISVDGSYELSICAVRGYGDNCCRGWYYQQVLLIYIYIYIYKDITKRDRLVKTSHA